MRPDPDGENNGPLPSLDTWVDTEGLPLDGEGDTFAALEDARYATFDQAIEAVEGGWLEPSILTGFSDLSRNDVRRLRNVWRALPDESRVTIAEHALAMGEQDLLLDFMRFFGVLLDDDLAAVRQVAATGLAPYDDEALIGPLTKRATIDPDEDVRVAAMASLGTFMTLGEFGMLDNRTINSLRNVLLTAVRDTSASTRLRAAALAGASVDSEDREIKEAIGEFFASGDAELRIGAIHAMGRSVDGHWLPLLETTLRSSDPDERQVAARSLGSYEDRSVVPMLTMVAREDREMPVRLEAIQALGTVGGRHALQSLQTLREHVSDDEVELVDAAIAEAEDLVALEQGPPDDVFDFDDDGTRL